VQRHTYSSQPQGITAPWPVPNLLLGDRILATTLSGNNLGQIVHTCEQLAQDYYLKAEWPGFEPMTFSVASPLA